MSARPTQRLAALAVALLSLFALLAGTSGAHATAAEVLDIAHRGSSGSAPENTLAAVKRALTQHASYVEVDVQRSADGKLVIMHDTTLERTTDVERIYPDRASWRVGDFTLAELRKLDTGSWFGARFGDETVPTLREVVRSLGERAGLLLEVKAPSRYPGIEADVHRELSAIPGYLDSALADDRLVVQSFDIGSMRRYHRIAPKVPLGLLFSSRPSAAQLLEASTWAEQINPNYRVTDQALVDRVQQLGMAINVYTVNTRRLMRQYIGLGVDGIITNYPGVLRDITVG